MKFSVLPKDKSLWPVLATIIVTIAGLLVIRWSRATLLSIDSRELIAMAAVALAGGNIALQLAMKKLDLTQQKKTKLSLDVAVTGRLARITCSIECTGLRRITPKNIYLFVEKGRRSARGVYEFPFLLKHEVGAIDCNLALRCKRERVNEFPQDLVGPGYETDFAPVVMSLDHLSSASILFVDPGEVFSEDATIELRTPGVYRATIVFTAADSDCMCRTRHFLVQPATDTQAADEGDQ